VAIMVRFLEQRSGYMNIPMVDSTKVLCPLSDEIEILIPDDSLVCFIIQVNTSMSFDSFIHSFVAICKVHYVEKVESEIILVDLHSSRLTRVTLDY